jgi:DNA-binding HxlR family transcriptional regulator
VEENSSVKERSGYGQFCPVAMGAEILCSKWTVLIIRELLCGSTRFNDLRRGVPRMSPTLLSRRLKALEDAGVIRSEQRGSKGVEYRLTRAGEDLRGIVMDIGRWGQRWVERDISLKAIDPSLLMWDMRRRLNPTHMPPGRSTLKFHFPEAKQGQQDWWLVIDRGKVDLCGFDPGFDVDLYIAGSLRAMTAVWMGLGSMKEAVAKGELELVGDKTLSRTAQEWLGLSVFAKEKKLAAA